MITRTVAVSQLAEVGAQRAPLALLEELTLENLVRHRVTIGLSANDRTRRGADAVLFGDAIGRRGLTLATTSLDTVYLLIIPIVALLVGSNLLPYDQRVYGSVFSLPVRRSSLYVTHFLVLLAMILVFFWTLALVNLLLLFALHGAPDLP